MKIYLAGPMRAYPEFNFPAFAAAAAYLRSWGHEVWSPHEHDLANGFDPTVELDETGSAPGFSFAEAMRKDLQIITMSDGIVLLPGWEKSTGARIERFVADTTNREVWLYHPDVGNVCEGHQDDPANLGELARTSPAPPWGLWLADPVVTTLEELADANASSAPAIRQFASGASRDADTEKLQFARFFDPLVVQRRAEYMHHHRHQADGSLREPDNWKLGQREGTGIPIQAFMDGLARHEHDAWMIHEYGEVFRPETGESVDLEDALCAIMFNAEGWLRRLLLEKRALVEDA